MKSIIDQMSNVKESTLSYMYGCAKQGNPLDIQIADSLINGLDDNERAHLVDPAATKNNWVEKSGSYKINGDTKTITGRFTERFFEWLQDTFQVTCKVSSSYQPKINNIIKNGPRNPLKDPEPSNERGY
jgi:hypothetical protein